MPTDKDKLILGAKRLAYTILLMFSGPIVLYQAFKNQEHPWYIPVLIVGLLLALGAILMGFWGIRTLVTALFSKGPDKGE